MTPSSFVQCGEEKRPTSPRRGEEVLDDTVMWRGRGAERRHGGERGGGDAMAESRRRGQGFYVVPACSGFMSNSSVDRAARNRRRGGVAVAPRGSVGCSHSGPRAAEEDASFGQVTLVCGETEEKGMGCGWAVVW
jgi:hypothetical protein